MMLAQILPDMTKGIPMLLVSAGALLWITNELFKLAKNVKGKKPEPPNEQLEVKQQDLSRRIVVLEESIVGREWFSKIERDIDIMRQESSKHREDRDRTDSIHRSSIYKAIEKVRVETSEHIESVRKELSGDIKDMPTQVVTLLKNTNAI